MILLLQKAGIRCIITKNTGGVKMDDVQAVQIARDYIRASIKVIRKWEADNARLHVVHDFVRGNMRKKLWGAWGLYRALVRGSV
jgi:hypothetical protein